MKRLLKARYSFVHLVLSNATAMLLVAALSWAVTVPHTFTAGAVASSAQVNANFVALRNAVNALEAKLQYVTVSNETIAGVAGPHMIVTGANLHVRSGSGCTSDGDSGNFCLPDGSLTGLGNLIIGYDESFSEETEAERTGSHNLVIGAGHRFVSSGGVVAGNANQARARGVGLLGSGNVASGDFASVLGGGQNTAEADQSVVVGGGQNTASGQLSAILGGRYAEAMGLFATVSGGSSGAATGDYASVAGGNGGTASGDYASVLGGLGNTASADFAAVLGGNVNNAAGINATVSGGDHNTAGGASASVAGGANNQATAYASTVVGGGGASSLDANVASGQYATVGGGRKNVADTTGGAVGGSQSQNTSSNYQFLP